MNYRVAAIVLVCAAAHAATPGLSAETDTGRIDLFQEAGQCVGQARRATYVPLKGEPIEGCWTFTGNLVRIVFMDGDSGDLPPQAFKKPKTL